MSDTRIPLGSSGAYWLEGKTLMGEQQGFMAEFVDLGEAQAFAAALRPMDGGSVVALFMQLFTYPCSEEIHPEGYGLRPFTHEGVAYFLERAAALAQAPVAPPADAEDAKKVNGLAACPFCPDGGDPLVNLKTFNGAVHETVRCQKCRATAMLKDWDARLEVAAPTRNEQGEV